MHRQLVALFWALYAFWYDRLWDMPLTRGTADEVSRLAPPALPVVEVGAGTGLITRLLAVGHHVELATEPAPGMRRRLLDRRLEVDRIGDEAIAELRLPAGDRCVVAVNVLHLVPDPAEALAALIDLAGPRGCVIVVTPAARGSVGTVVSAARLLGAGNAWAARFIAAHLVLAPLAALARVPRVEHSFDGYAVVTTVGGVQEIRVFAGTGSPLAS